MNDDAIIIGGATILLGAFLVFAGYMDSVHSERVHRRELEACSNICDGEVVDAHPRPNAPNRLLTCACNTTLGFEFRAARRP
jgi:hypothetical protein